ncbi:PilZ domain-containing protein [Terrilactibacillus sp. S3-3]|nr:PilZ domain-containing protein [Terrilactibacillus sp. S3-3]
MTRIQRRNYVRVTASLDIAIHADRPVPVRFTTLTSDIGGGGTLIHLPDKNILSEGAGVIAWVVLPMSSGLNRYIKLDGTVVRVFTDPTTQKEMASIQFHYAKEKDREPVIRYCFERELQTRRMSLKWK